MDADGRKRKKGEKHSRREVAPFLGGEKNGQLLPPSVAVPFEPNGGATMQVHSWRTNNTPPTLYTSKMCAQVDSIDFMSLYERYYLNVGRQALLLGCVYALGPHAIGYIL